MGTFGLSQRFITESTLYAGLYVGRVISQYKETTPERTQHLIPYMISQNWLLQYQSIKGLNNILGQMNRRTKGRSNMDQAAVELQMHYPLFEQEFYDFFKILQKEASAELNRLTV